MMVQIVDRPNTTPIGQDREALTLTALLYLNVAVNAQVCRLFYVVNIALFSLVQLGYPAITNIFVVNRIINNSSPECRCLAVDIYRAAKRRGKY